MIESFKNSIHIKNLFQFKYDLIDSSSYNLNNLKDLLKVLLFSFIKKINNFLYVNHCIHHHHVILCSFMKEVISSSKSFITFNNFYVVCSADRWQNHLFLMFLMFSFFIKYCLDIFKIILNIINYPLSQLKYLLFRIQVLFISNLFVPILHLKLVVLL